MQSRDHVLVSNTSWRQFQFVFRVTIVVVLQNILKRSSRRLEDIFVRRQQNVINVIFKTWWKTRNYYTENLLKKLLEDDFMVSWRPKKHLLGTNLNMYLTNLHLKNVYLEQIKDALIRTQWFQYSLVCET